MAKKLLCIVLSVAMLLGTFAIASSAACTFMTAEDVADILASKEWEEEYDASVDYKDLINRKWLTGVNWENLGAYFNIPEVAAPEAILEENLSFWADEIIEAYNAASSNEEFWTLYNKMNTPKVAEYYCPYCDEIEYDVLFEYGYEYKAEEKAKVELELVADKQYVKAGDTITVDVFATANFYTAEIFGGIFYNKNQLECTSVAFDATANPTWKELDAQTSAFATDETKNMFWPESMLNAEDMATYGVTYIAAAGNNELGAGNYDAGYKYNGERMFTATYTVKADVAEGTEIELFIPDGSTLAMEDVLYLDMGERNGFWRFKHVVYPGSTDDVYLTTTDDHCMFDQTVTANTLTLTVGEEPVVEPEVKGEIVNVIPSETYIGDTAVVSVEVTGAPDSLRVVTADGYQIFTRDDATIEATEAGETWIIELFVDAEKVECEVFADYGDLGVTDGTAFVLTGLVKQDLGVYSIEIPDMYPNAQNGGVITAGKHDIIIKTSTDVTKVQFYDPADGTTYTYTSWEGRPGYAPYEDIDGERVWTISHAFGPFGTRSLVIRTRSATTFFAATDKTLDATVVY